MDEVSTKKNLGGGGMKGFGGAGKDKELVNGKKLVKRISKKKRERLR